MIPRKQILETINAFYDSIESLNKECMELNEPS